MQIQKTIEICTFPEDDENFCHCFEVSTRWLAQWLFMNYNTHKTIKEYIDEYDWTSSYMVYCDAQITKAIISEYEQP